MKIIIFAAALFSLCSCNEEKFNSKLKEQSSFLEEKIEKINSSNEKDLKFYSAQQSKRMESLENEIKDLRGLLEKIQSEAKQNAEAAKNQEKLAATARKQEAERQLENDQTRKMERDQARTLRENEEKKFLIQQIAEKESAFNKESEELFKMKQALEYEKTKQGLRNVPKVEALVKAKAIKVDIMKSEIAALKSQLNY